MIDFALPYAWILLPLPLLAWRLLPRAEAEGGGVLRIPFFDSVRELPGSPAAAGRRGAAVLALKTLAWVLLVAAAAQPRWLGEPQPVTTSGRDLMLALDLSGSMNQEDFSVQGHAVDRLGVVRAVAQDFVRHRVGDRVGLVLFGSRAYLQAPLTFDRETVVEMLDEGEVGLAGEETAIGDAIGLAVKYLRDRSAEDSVLVLLSDGASNAGALDPVRAAEIAAEQGIRIYTIGVGSDTAVIQTLFGPRRVPARTDLDEETLSAIAERTGGRYFRARDTDALVDVYRQIDALEPTEGDAASVRPTRALFYWPLAGAAAASALLWLLGWLREIRGTATLARPLRREVAA